MLIVKEKSRDSSIQKLRRYFEKEPQVLLAFVFGSFAEEREMEESDVDVAVYLKDKRIEGRISRAVGRILGREVDLIHLDKAPATLVSSVFKKGIPLLIRDKNLYWNMYLEKTMEAEDFAEFAQSFWEISCRIESLAQEDRTRLIQRFEFLKNEFVEVERFRPLTFQEYQDEKEKRWAVERWTENILNATIDIAKIVLAAEKKGLPRTYEEALFSFGLLVGMSEQEADQFSKFAKLRNILAHEYLDILYKRIQNFIQKYPRFYKQISSFLERYLEE